MTDLKIEAGKCYRTRDGRKAHVLGARYDQQETFPMIGYIEGKACPDSWTCSGQFFSSGPSHADLISEWKEPRKGEVWVNIVTGGSPASYPNKETADAAALLYTDRGYTIEARLGPIPWTEGQGLTGEGSE